MSTVITHAIVPLTIGLGLGKKIIPLKVVFLGCLFAVLPDIDIIAFEMGISYYSQFGHRGFTHSLFFSVFCALLAVCFSSLPFRPRLYMFLFLALSMFSHALMDALTHGGLGPALAWPFSTERIFFDWRPLPVPQIGISRFFTPWGRFVFETEVYRVWLPFIGLMVGLWCFRYFKRF